ncbi:MAG: hypothetical protein MJZ68_00985 [archaeon]|nr:hypothetical protein [archaeon]
MDFPMCAICPNEADPRPKVGMFVSDTSVKVIPGLRPEGLKTLMDIVEEEVFRQRKDENVVVVDREVLSEERIILLKDLKAFSDRMFRDDVRTTYLIKEELHIPEWQTAFMGKGADVLIGSLGCRQVPLCIRFK